MTDPLRAGYIRRLNPIDRVSGIPFGLIVAATLLFLGEVALGRCAVYTRPAQTGLAMALLVLIAAVKTLGGQRRVGDARE